MNIKVNEENVFRSYGSTMAIAATTSGYTLEFSVDGNDWDELQEVPAEENLIVTDVVNGMYFKLTGNEDENVLVKF